MPRKPTDYKKLYQESQELFLKNQDSFDELAVLNSDLENKHRNLNKEFDKAVEINKQFQNTIVEQRGIINYLELQVKKLDEKLTKTEKSNERT
jgi:predicted Rossmann fold nucleotide-binding protein DprA/Smf involved in DNA uptake